MKLLSGMDAKLFDFIMFSAIMSLCNSQVLKSPLITNWGQWTTWSSCPSNQFAIGMQLKVEGDQGSGDDTALNGIRLLCAPIGQCIIM